MRFASQDEWALALPFVRAELRIRDKYERPVTVRKNLDSVRSGLDGRVIFWDPGQTQKQSSVEGAPSTGLRYCQILVRAIRNTVETNPQLPRLRLLREKSLDDPLIDNARRAVGESEGHTVDSSLANELQREVNESSIFYLVVMEEGDVVYERGRTADMSVLTAIKQRGCLTVGCLQWSPFIEYDPALEHGAGLYGDLVQRIGDSLNVRVVYKPRNLVQCLDGILNRDLDIVPALFDTPRRRAYGDICGFVHMASVLWVKARNRAVSILDPDLKVAVTLGGMSDELATDFYGVVSPYRRIAAPSDNFAACLEYVHNKTAHVALVDSVSYLSDIRRDELEVLAPPAFMCPVGFMVPKDQPAMRDVIECELAKARRDSGFRDLESKVLAPYSQWMMSTPTPDDPLAK